jgi:hypothetical protein
MTPGRARIDALLGLSAAREEWRAFEELLAVLRGASIDEQNVQRVLLTAQRHGMVGHLAARHPSFHRATLGVQAHAIRQLQLARDAADAIEKAGIRGVVLKGVASAQVWPEPLWRGQSDLDFLVAKRDVPRAMDALVAAKVADRRLGGVAEHGHNSFLETAPPQKVLIELHHDLSSHHPLKVDIDELLARRVMLTTARGPIPGLSNEDTVTFLALHAATHALKRLAWLYDLVGYAKRDDVDWQQAAARAKEWNAQLPVYLAWRAAVEWLDARIPVSAIEALTPRLTQGKIVDWLLQTSRFTQGNVARVAEIAFRLALVHPRQVGAVLLRKARSKREERKAMKESATKKAPAS